MKNIDKFCEISKKKSSAKILYEDKDVMAFLDNKPYSKGHTLIIPKKHFKDIHDVSPRILKKIILLAAKISKKISQNFDGTIILHNTGKLADIPHFHLHIFGKSANKKRALYQNWLVFEAELCLLKRVSTLYDMRVNIIKGFVAGDAAACAPINMVSVAGIAASVNIPLGRIKNITRKISAGSKAISLMARH